MRSDNDVNMESAYNIWERGISRDKIDERFYLSLPSIILQRRENDGGEENQLIGSGAKLSLKKKKKTIKFLIFVIKM